MFFSVQTIKTNDKVGIISTARHLSYNELIPTINWLKKQNLTPILGKTLSLQNHQFAGDDSQRIDDIQQMIDDKQIRIIWCARGGYGTARLLDHINFSSLKNNPKWIVGYSDVTALHCHLNTKQIPTIHATMPINITQNTPEALESLKNIFFEKSNHYQWENNFTSYPKQVIEAELIGGNLSVIYSLLGSKSAPNTDGKILLLEDIDEYLYHIDRMMLNLKRNGLLKNLKAILVGGFTQIKDNPIPFGKTAEQIILEYSKEEKYPVIFNAPFGHLSDNRAFILGKKATIYIENHKINFYQ